MNGYYRDVDRVVRGPVAWEEMEVLASQGAIRPHTLVVVDVREGWRTWHEVRRRRAARRDVPDTSRCVACGTSGAADRLAWLGPHPVCASCRPWVVDRIREGRTVRVWTETAKANPAARLTARVIDGMMVGAAQAMLAGILAFPLIAAIPVLHRSLGLTVLSVGILAPVALVYLFGLPVIIEAWCLHRWGGTPGKLATGIRVSADDTGGTLSWGRALGRAVAVWCSAMPLGLGYLRVAWDPGGQMLHDLICNTRVHRTERRA